MCIDDELDRWIRRVCSSLMGLGDELRRLSNMFDCLSVDKSYSRIGQGEVYGYLSDKFRVDREGIKNVIIRKNLTPATCLNSFKTIKSTKQPVRLKSWKGKRV